MRTLAIDLKLLEPVEAAVAVLLAISWSHFMRLDHVAWGAFTAYVVIRREFALSLARGLMRMVGTAAGAALACSLPAIVFSNTGWGALTLALAGGVTLYLAITERHGYVWFSLILTFATAMTGCMDGADTSALSTSRIAEVATGTLAAIVTSAISAFLIAPGLNPDCRDTPSRPQLPRGTLHDEAAIQALKGALSLAAIPVLVHELHFAGAAQASMTVPAVLMIPLAEAGASCQLTRRRVTGRLVGCLLGGLAGTVGLSVAGWSQVAVSCFVACGVAAGRCVENLSEKSNYLGAQSVLAFLVVTVSDKHAAIDIAAGLDRAIGIASGIMLLLPSIWLVASISWARKAWDRNSRDTR